FSLLLAQSDAGEFRISEKAERDLPAGRNMTTTSEVVTNHAEIVNADVGKLRAACYLADCPNAGCRRLKPLIDLHVSALCQLDAGKLQGQPLCVRSAACRNQDMTALQRFLHAILLQNDFY